jgi:hypothetical protein
MCYHLVKKVCQILELNPQFVDFSQFSKFKIAWLYLGAKAQTPHPLTLTEHVQTMQCLCLAPTVAKPITVTHESLYHILPPTLTTTTTILHCALMTFG